MSVFVISLISKEKIPDEKINEVKGVLSNEFSNDINNNRFDYKDQDYYEVDFDIIDFSFTQKNLYDKLAKLIKAFEEIFRSIKIDFDIISSLNDNNSIIERHESDINKMQHIYGILATRKTHRKIESFYTSKEINVYVDFKDSIWTFGINLAVRDDPIDN